MYTYFVVLAGLLFVTEAAQASNVDVNINLGAPPPVVVREVAPQQRTVIIEDVPDFVYPPALGFYVAVGTPHDLFFFGGNYYLFREGRWHRGYDYNGPWTVIREKNVPYGLRKHRFETIHQHRDREYATYQREHDRYRGKHFRPDREWQERRKHERNEYKERERSERREFKEQRKSEREEIRDHRKFEHEERKNDRQGHEKHGRGRED
jgi:hypothetical protein